MTLLVSDQLSTHLVWFDDEAMLPGRRFVLKSGTSSIGAVEANEIGCINLSLDRPLVCEAYRDDREFGSFILIDSITRPAAPEITIDTTMMSADAACELIVNYLREHHYL